MIPAPEVAGEPSVPKAHAPAWAWGICGLMFASTMLNYLDRQAISLVGPQIKAEFGIRNEAFGWVMAAFFLSYAFWQVLAGYLVDRYDARWTYAAAVTWWSLAGMATAFVPSLGAIMACRALLGVGESFNWPCALRVTGTILPPADRSLGNGIFNSGAAVGAVLAPLVITQLTIWYGWRAAFVAVASLGFLWVGAWIWLLGGRYNELFAGRTSVKPARDEALLAGEEPARASGLANAAFGALAVVSALIGLLAFRYGLAALWWGIALFMFGLLFLALALPMHALKGADWSQSLGEIVRMRRFWILVVVSISINICWHFLINWLPTYLQEDRGMRYRLSGLVAALPFLAADLGNLGGGAASLLLTFRNIAPERARGAVMTVCLVLVSVGIGVSRIPNDLLMIAVLCLMALGTAAFMANYFAFCQEVSVRHTGFITGILGGLGNLAVAGFLPMAGWIKDLSGGFGPVFVIVGLAPWIGLATLALGWRSPEAHSPAS